MNEATRVLALYMDDVASGRIREDLADNCRLRWYTGNIRRSPTLVSEFFRFHILPQYSHIAFGECKQGNADEVSELTQLYNLNIGNYETPSHRRNLNCITYQHKHLHRRAESDTDAEDDDDEDEMESLTTTSNRSETNKLLCDDDTLQIKEWVPSSASLPLSPTTSSTKVTRLTDDSEIGLGNGKGLVVITKSKSSSSSLASSSSSPATGSTATVLTGPQPQPPPQELLRCIKTEGELHCSALSVSTEDAIIKVRLQIVYRFCTRFHIPEFVLISYERIGNDGTLLPSRRPVRMNLRAHFDAVATDEDTNDNDYHSTFLDSDDEPLTSTRSTIATLGTRSGVARHESIESDYNRFRDDNESTSTSLTMTSLPGSLFQLEQTPPRSLNSTSKLLQQHQSRLNCVSPSSPTTSTMLPLSRKRQCDLNTAYVRNKRKAMRRLRL